MSISVSQSSVKENQTFSKQTNKYNQRASTQASANS